MELDDKISAGVDGALASILLVDDSAVNLGVVVEGLESHGYEVLVALDGEEALERMEVAMPDIVLLDVMMPGIDGFEVCRRLKAQAHTRDIPVIFMTSLSATHDKVQGFAVGGVDYITKPLNIDETRARIKTHLELRALRLALETRNAALQQEVAERVRAEEALERTVEQIMELNRNLELQAEELRASREQVEITEAWYRGIVRSAPDGMVVVDERGRIALVNEHLEQMFGYAEGELLGQAMEILLPPDVREVHVGKRNGFFASGTLTRPMETMVVDGLRACRKDGSEFPVDVSLSRLPNDSGRGGVVCAAIRDITVRKEGEQLLEEARRRLSSVLQTIPDMVWLKDADGAYLICNHAFERFMGRPRAEIVGKTDFDFMPAEQAEVFRRQDGEALAADDVCVIEEWVEWADSGKRVLLETRKLPMLNRGGEVVGVLGMARDITERYLMEHALAEREQEFRALVENSPDVVMRYDRECRRTYVNPVFLELVGKTAAEMLGGTPTEYDARTEAHAYERALREAMDSGDEVEHEYTWRAAGGRRLVSHFRIVPEFDGRGEVISVLSIGRDITERKQAELATDEARMRLLGVLQTIPDLVWLKDTDGVYMACNNSFEAFFGAREVEIVGKTDYDFVAADLADFFRQKDKEAIDAGEMRINEEWITLAKDDRLVLLETRKVPMRNALGQVIGVLGIGRDITESQRMARALAEREQEFRVLVENSPDVVVRYDCQLRRIYINPEWERVNGITAFDALGRTPSELCGAIAGQVHEFEAQLQAVIHSGKGREIELNWLDEHGGQVCYLMRAVPEFDEDLTVKSVLTVASNISSRKQMETILRQREEEFRSLVENTPDTVARYDRECRRIYANPAFVALAGGASASLLGKTITETNPTQAGQAYEDKVRSVFDGKSPADFNLEWRAHDGREITSAIRLMPELDDGGAVRSVLAVGRDITDLAEYQRKIHRLAYYDPLTGLPNRRLFQERIHQVFMDAEQNHHRVGVMLLDLDHFKMVNDSFGHHIGDGLLEQVSERLMQCVRGYDTVARLGGDEFGLILPEVRAGGDLGGIAGKILHAFTEPFDLEGREVFVSGSIGIAYFPDDGRDEGDLLKFADSAMYLAKRSGRNSYRFYSSELSEETGQRVLLEAELRKGIARGELELYYQPKLNLDGDTLCGSEALLRWNHSQRGLVPPDRFIGIAEETGLICEMGDWVIRQACRVATEWNGPGRPLHKIAINLSARQFQSGDLVETLRTALETSGCAPGWIELEITESLLLDGDSEIRDILSELRRMGFTIAIDDFGTGYSSLSYLGRFPVNVLKIDRSFIRDMMTEGYHSELVKAIISLASCLRLKVVAEGVETVAQRDFLRACGCEMAQGYLYGKPMPQAHFEEQMLAQA